MLDDINALTDAEIDILIELVRSAKEWAQLCLNSDSEEKLKRIYDKLDDMKNNYG